MENGSCNIRKAAPTAAVASTYLRNTNIITFYINISISLCNIAFEDAIQIKYAQTGDKLYNFDCIYSNSRLVYSDVMLNY